MKWTKTSSIRTKLLVGFSVIVLTMFGALFLLNQFLMEDFFLRANKSQMIEVTDEINAAVETEGYGEIGRQVSRDIGGQVMILSEDGGMIEGESLPTGSMNEGNPLPVGSMSEGEPLPAGRHPDHGAPIESFFDQAEVKEDGFFQVAELMEGEKQIMYIRQLDDGNYVVINKGMGIVRESGVIYVRFLGISSVIVFLLGFVFLYFYADRFTRPIIRLKSSAEKMAVLDFSEQVTTASKDELGQLVHSVNAMADALSLSIDDLNASNHLLEKELSKERNLEDMRRRFVSDVSHELRNPISMIIGYADGIERGVAKNMEDRKYYARVIKEEGKRMNRLVSDLLDISSYTSGTFTIKEDEVDVAELIRTVLSRYHAITKEKSVEVEMDGDYTVMVRGDELRLEQVFTNLLDNACKHVDSGGSIKASVNNFKEKVRITIANTGNLIPNEELDNIWKSFYQIDTDAKGNGLGLTIVKSIIELHEGSIRVYVKDGMNCFEVCLNKKR